MSSTAAAATLALCAIANLTACGDRAPKNNNEADAGGPGAYLDGQLTEDAAVTPCGQDADCPGAGPCLVGVCDAGYCTQQPAPEGTACDDGDLCTASDGCSAGVCDGAAVICDDGDPCTADSCEMALGCTATINEAACDDGDACTVDACDSVAGCSHAPVDCDNENPCTSFACDVEKGCVYTPLPEDTPCAETGACVGGYCQRDGQVLVPKGGFWMGCNPALNPWCHGIEYTVPPLPQEYVETDAYWIDLLEVTAGEYQACIDAGACATPKPTGLWLRSCSLLEPGEQDHAMSCATWSQAMQYCAWVGKSLPSEAQWERAARGGCETVSAPCKANMRTYPWGEAAGTCEFAVFKDLEADVVAGCGTGGALPGGTRSPAGDSPYKLRDMSGNVAEWTLEPFDNRPGIQVVVHHSVADWGKYRIRMGGGFATPSVVFIQPWWRIAVWGESPAQRVGFRCARISQ